MGFKEIAIPYFRGKLFFFEFGLIKVRKLFKGGNYSRAETIRGNTVCYIQILSSIGFSQNTIVTFQKLPSIP